MTKVIMNNRVRTSVSIYTQVRVSRRKERGAAPSRLRTHPTHLLPSPSQITDVENECDGFLNMDRTNKFTPAQQASIAAANAALIKG